jgi:hypothetical protein
MPAAVQTWVCCQRRRTLVGTWPTESPCAFSMMSSQLACFPALSTIGCSCRTTFSQASWIACNPGSHQCWERVLTFKEKGSTEVPASDHM